MGCDAPCWNLMGQYGPNRPEGRGIGLKEEALPLGIGLYRDLEPILWQGHMIIKGGPLPL
jgi:hypothetical protein